ncbi:hypothetical protein ACS5PM_18055 [Ideonella sp. YS5]
MSSSRARSSRRGMLGSRVEVCQSPQIAARADPPTSGRNREKLITAHSAWPPELHFDGLGGHGVIDPMGEVPLAS